MRKPIMIDDVPHRWRRGKLVPIPPEWVGRTVGRQTISRRYSKNRAKKIESKQDRAREKAAMASGEEPDPKLRRRKTKWYRASGESDLYRDKFRAERRASHPSKET